ncbi:MAG TPA: carbohydrate-binding protein, partial [Cytophagaceae bacterium]|nr:carbohydrate-binding protein [Cytophagaceae bacterium]
TMIPTDQYFVTTSADGIWTSSDFYLRLAGAGTELLKGTRAISSSVPVPYSLGPVYHRNGFEKRHAVYNATGTPGSGSGYFNIDPCFYDSAVVSNTGITSPSVSIVNNPSFTKSGLYSVMATGTPTSGSSANYYYKTSVTKIAVKANMQLSFWKYSLNSLGQYTSVDLLFQSGKRLSSLPAYVDSVGYAMTPAVARGRIGSWQKFTCQIGVGELIGDTITGIIIGYDNPSTSGSYTAYFDDIIIEDAIALTRMETPYGGTAWPIPGKIEAENYDYGGEGIAYHDYEEENKLNQFRTNEAVDIESTGDAGGGYDVGWIETGEWLKYMVNVQTAGTYSLEARVASPNTGKSLHVELDGVNISGTITVPNTTGWQTWQTVSVTTPVLTTGQKTLKVVMDTDGFNLNDVNFVLLTPLSINGGADHNTIGNATTAKGISSIAVYPNPVKADGNVNIQFVNQEAGKYQVRLYNYLGQSVFQTTVNVASGMFIYSLDLLQQLSSGYYQIEIISESGCTMQRIVIQ